MILIGLLGCILLWGVFMSFSKGRRVSELKKMGLNLSLFLCIMSIISWVLCDGMMFVMPGYCSDNNILFVVMNSGWRLGLDGISLYFIILSTFLIFISILCGWDSIRYRVKEYILLMLVTDLLLILFFSIQDVLGFYVLFESLLIPMYLLIGMWGSRERRLHAAYQFFLYTLCGSLIMLLGIIILYNEVGGTDMSCLLELNKVGCNIFIQKCIWLSFFVALSVKIPMVPLHLWLPEAHVEAPTGGSVLLAGILLKMGGYGFIRLSLPLGIIVNEYFYLLVYMISVLGILYTSLITFRQVDMKKIIAYASIGHMNYVTLGIFSNNIQGVVGSVFLMLSHGFVSSGLFLCVGMLYDRYKTRLVMDYGGLVQLMPVFSVLFFILILANVGFPGTSSFVGEIMILIGLIKVQFIVVFLSGLSIVFSAIYSIWCFNRVMFGELGRYSAYCDVTKREFYILIVLVFIIIILGVKPMLVLDLMQYNMSKVLIVW